MALTDRVHPVELVGWLVVAFAFVVAFGFDSGATLAEPLVVFVAAPLVFLGVAIDRLRHR
jgi:hypothetical protein